MRGVFCTTQTPKGLFIYINEQDFIDRPALKQTLGSYSKTTKPAERWQAAQGGGEEPVTFVGWEFSPDDFLAMRGYLVVSGFREDNSIAEKFEAVK